MTADRDAPAAIVLGVEHPRALAVVRSLGRMGVPVVGLDHLHRTRGMSSRYLRETIFVPEASAAALAAIESLDRYAGALLIPTNDHYVELVARNAERLAPRFTVTLPPWEITHSLMDKRRCYALAHSIGIAAPQTFAPTTVEELDRVLTHLDFEHQSYLLTKQLPLGVPTDRTTHRYTRVGGEGAATVRARSLEMLERAGELPLIAEVVPGESTSCVGVSMVLDRKLESLAWYVVRRLQLRPYRKDEGFVHPYELGANVYCESTHDDEAVEAAQRLLRAAGYYGTATVEFRRDARDGTLTLIKVDPRFVRATSLSLALGVDLPRVLYLAFTEQPVPAPQPYATGSAWIWITWYLDTLRQQPLRVAARHLRAVLGNLRRVKAEAYLSTDDPLPFVIDVREWARNNIRGLFRRLVRRWRPSHQEGIDSKRPSPAQDEGEPV